MLYFLRSVPVLILVLLLSYSLLESSVIINEIMNDPVLVSDSNGEWFELHNVGDDTLDLNGWSISDSSRDYHEFFLEGGLLIPPGSYFVFGREADPSINGGYAPDYVYKGFTLSNSEDEFMLFDDGDGDYGTPGQKNSASAVGVGEGGTGMEVGDDPVLFLNNYPNPFNGSTTITFEGVKEQGSVNYQHLNGGPAVALKVYDLRGRLVRDLWEGDLDGKVTLTWDGRDNRGARISPGLYLLQLTGKEAACQRKVVFQGR